MCPIYEYECVVCGKIFEEFRSFSERNNVKHCGKTAVKLISLPNTTPDLMYTFNTEIFGGKPVTIKSKEHYKQMLRQHNMIDASPLECLKEGRTKKAGRELKDRQQVKVRAKRLADKMKVDNVAHVAKDAMKLLTKKGE